MIDYTVCSATELVALYQTASASPVTVTEQILAKIERVNPALNAFCHTDPDTSLQQARDSERRWQQNTPLSLLDGIPIGIKDLLLTQNWPTLKGSFDIAVDQPWLTDDPYVAKLRSAGCVFLGKTTTSEYGYRIDGYSARTGNTLNPWNMSKTSGGSSAGSAAAVSAGLGPICIGSDQYGSIARPAAFCGVMGFKPTGDTVIGPIANTVEDCALIQNFSFIQDTIDLNKLKIAVCQDKTFNQHTDAFDIAINTLKKYFTLNSVMFDIDLYSVANWISIIRLYHNQQKFLQFSNVQQQDLANWTNIHEIQNIDPSKTKIALIRVEQTRRYIQTLMQKCDILITTAANITAPGISTICPKSDYEKSVPVYSVLWNITHQPAITVPVGLVNGLPFGIQIVGAVGKDNLVLQFARSIEKLFVKMHPDIFYKSFLTTQ